MFDLLSKNEKRVLRVLEDKHQKVQVTRIPVINTTLYDFVWQDYVHWIVSQHDICRFRSNSMYIKIWKCRRVKWRVDCYHRPNHHS